MLPLNDAFCTHPNDDKHTAFEQIVCHHPTLFKNYLPH